MRKKIELPEGYVYDGPFIKQKDHADFDYTIDYKARQSTNSEMSHLRLGWLSSHIPYDQLSKMKGVDIGSGNGVFVKYSSNFLGSVVGYDLCGVSITEKELYDTEWDIIFLSDVLEHFDDIRGLFKYKWKYAMISFPETPDVDDFETLMKWRHFKPNEHIYHLYQEGMEQWLENIDEDVVVVASSHFEDHIRRRWDDDLPNITTMLLKK